MLLLSLELLKLTFKGLFFMAIIQEKQNYNDQNAGEGVKKHENYFA